jgi:polyphosphate kinase
MVDTCSASSIEFLLQQLGLQREDLYLVNGPVNLVRLMQVPDSVDLPALKFPPFAPGLTKAIERRGDMFELLRKGDVLLHHPYQSFAPVVEFLQEAVEDPQVVAIKLTVYRTGTDSKIMEALITAAQNGKDVTVVVELMARFDEEANLNWAAKLEQVGAHVVYGVFGYKTHAKMLMVVRREENRLRRYVHLGTGNYHARTAKLYTDFSLLTCNPDIGQDVHEVFNQITGLGRAGQLRHLWQSPFSLHLNVIFAIRREAEHARAGKPAAIIAKLNALLEPAVITELYEASRAGVKIDLIVRGVCALRPGIAGLSENIRVRSIVGRFLEHSRVYYFANVGAEDVYLASADWMERNFFRRIEVCFPVLDPKLKKRVIDEAIRRPLADAVQAWEMDSDGHYDRATGRRANAHSSQQSLLSELAVVARPRGYTVHAQGRAREATGST